MEKKEKKKSANWILLFLLLIIICFAIYIYSQSMITRNDFIYLMILLCLMALPLLAKKKETKVEVSAEESNLDSFSNNNMNMVQSQEEYLENLKKPAVKQTAKPAATKTPNPANAVPLIVLFAVFIYVFIGNPIDYILGSNPVGKWYYNMEVTGGNLTEYWYMVLEEDGTMTIGIKNQGYPEDPEGSGTWYMDGGVLYISIDYDWEGLPDVDLELQIKGNKLYDLYGVDTGYVKG